MQHWLMPIYFYRLVLVSVNIAMSLLKFWNKRTSGNDKITADWVIWYLKNSTHWKYNIAEYILNVSLVSRNFNFHIIIYRFFMHFTLVEYLENYCYNCYMIELPAVLTLFHWNTYTRRYLYVSNEYVANCMYLSYLPLSFLNLLFIGVRAQNRNKLRN
jgi:hypothetical protein